MNWSRCKGTLYLISDPTLPLLKFFTNARKDIESRLQSKSNLLRKQLILQGSTNKADKKENENNLFPNKLISLSKNIPSFRMTQDHPSSTTVLEKVINSNRPIVEKKGDLNHGRSKFSSEGSLGGLVAVLSRDPDVVWHLVHHVLQIATRHANHHLEGNHWSKGIKTGGLMIHFHTKDRMRKLKRNIESPRNLDQGDLQWAKNRLRQSRLLFRSSSSCRRQRTFDPFCFCKTRCSYIYNNSDHCGNSHMISLWRKIQNLAIVHQSFAHTQCLGPY